MYWSSPKRSFNSTLLEDARLDVRIADCPEVNNVISFKLFNILVGNQFAGF